MTMDLEASTGACKLVVFMKLKTIISFPPENNSRQQFNKEG